MLAAGTALLSTPTGAQEGGIVLTFGVQQELRWTDNAGLKSPAEGSTQTADTRLSFGFLSETLRDRLAFDASLRLRAESGDGAQDGFGLESPTAELSYVRTGANSTFEAQAFLRETYLDEPALSDPDGSGAALPILILQDGTRQVRGGRISLGWGTAAPFGVTLRAGFTETDFIGTTDAELADNTTTDAGVALRFTINDVTDATVDLNLRRYDKAGPTAATEATTLSAEVRRALPLGSLTGKISTTDDKDGSRHTLSFGRQIDLPRGDLGANIGLSRRSGSGGTDLTGSLSWRHELPRAVLSARLSHDITTDDADTETLVTALSLGMTQELSPRLSVDLGLVWNDKKDTGADTTTTTASLDAAFSYALTEDWGLNLGASHRIRDTDGAASAESSSVFVSLGRSFQVRP